MHRLTLLYLLTLAPIVLAAADRESMLAEAVSADIDRSDGRIFDANLIGYIHRVAQKVGGADVEFRVSRGPAAAARVITSKLIYLDGALLLRVQNEAELAGLLAHVLSHGGRKRGFMPECVLSIPFRNGAAQRDAEQQANESTIRALQGAGYDPAALTQLFLRPAFSHAFVREDLLALNDRITPIPGAIVDRSEFSKVWATLSPTLMQKTLKPSLYRNRP